MSKWRNEIYIIYIYIFIYILKLSCFYFLVLYHTALYRNGDSVDLIIYVYVWVL